MKASAVYVIPLILVAACASKSERSGSPGRLVPRAGLFASPIGEPFRSPEGENQWFAGSDANHDGKLTIGEMMKDTERFFFILDQGKDGEIDPTDMQRYETEIFPELRVAGAAGVRAGSEGKRGASGGKRGSGGRRGGGGGKNKGGDASMGNGASGLAYTGRGRLGAGRFSYLDIAQPIASADSNFNRGISLSELQAAAGIRFTALDTNDDGSLTLAELPEIPSGRGRS